MDEGPVVRINPHGLHFNAPNFIDEIYAGSSRTRDKYKWTPRIFSSKCRKQVKCSEPTVLMIGESATVDTIHDAPRSPPQKARADGKVFL